MKPDYLNFNDLLFEDTIIGTFDTSNFFSLFSIILIILCQ